MSAAQKMNSEPPKDQKNSDIFVVLKSRYTQDLDAVNQIIIENMQSDVALIPQLAGYLVASGGKRLRPLLTLLATDICDGEMSRAHRLAGAVEFIHTATLLHDDVVDASDKRRGKASANNIFGNEASVLVGDFLFSRAFQLMVADGSLETLRILSNASAIIAEGEVNQLSFQSQLDTTIDDYLGVIEGKTASLFGAACEVGAVIAQKKEWQEILAEYGLALGMAFQITDDALDYDPSRSKLGKTAGDDFREGKMTAPILYALEGADDEEKCFWQRTIADGDQKEADFDHALSLIQKHEGLERSLELSNTYLEKAAKSLAKLPQSAQKQLLLSLASALNKRNR